VRFACISSQTKCSNVIISLVAGWFGAELAEMSLHGHCCGQQRKDSEVEDEREHVTYSIML